MLSNEVSKAYLNAYKRILNWQPFMRRVYNIDGTLHALWLVKNPSDGVFLAVFPLFVRLTKYNFNFFTQKCIQKLWNLDINLLLIWLISNWTSCCTIQEVIVLFISNQTHVACSANFKIIHTITGAHGIVLRSVQLLFLITVLLHLHYIISVVYTLLHHSFQQMSAQQFSQLL